MTIFSKTAISIQVFLFFTLGVVSLTHAQYGSGNYGSGDYNDTADVTAPTLATVTAVITPNTDTTPVFTFSSDEAGTITYSGSCSSAITVAISGNNSIDFNTLAVGTYSDCTIIVTDTAANASTPLAVNEFTIQAVSSGGGGGGGRRTSSNDAPDNSSDEVPLEEVRRTVKTTVPPSFTFDNNISYIQSTVNKTNDVQYLSRFLNEFEGEELILDGVYGDDDLEAVKRFQTKYKKEVLDIWGLTEPTGYVGITTRLKINFLLKGQTAKCPAFTEYNGGRTGIFFSDEIRRTQEILTKLDLYTGEISGNWTPRTHDALVAFQELFREVMLDPWDIQKGTGYKYKTTNKFLNYFAGCDTPPVELEGIVGTFDF